MTSTGPGLRLKACVDVDYREQEAVSACLLFETWAAGQPTRTLVERVAPVAPYVPGSFYLRELPCLLAPLRQVTALIDTVIVDGYVWLDQEGRPGLGAHLYDALEQQLPVIGVAKSAFRGAPAVEVRRGDSTRPLYVTAAGMNPRQAAEHIQEMHGAHRLPSLLRQVDQLCRRA
ncbi:endonuclease V (plasmid) [Deinococcus taeanensis]|uniref:endonuclease V n=1 Tax=Deinococcus taeanensis TaxID=2737050 RepID=UPI001CDCB9BD|nr:endonuclease V [Deinococcus taeanensis]UBV45317.1 endonuclease V [Deinococcus taeanensis]